jgi:hypothetical protein
VKLSAPYWFHLMSYKSRISMASIASGLACLLVGWGGLCRDEKISSDDVADQRWGLTLQLLGVSFISFSCSLGEVRGTCIFAACTFYIVVHHVNSNVPSSYPISRRQYWLLPESLMAFYYLPSIRHTLIG